MPRLTGTGLQLQLMYGTNHAVNKKDGISEKVPCSQVHLPLNLVYEGLKARGLQLILGYLPTFSIFMI